MSGAAKVPAEDGLNAEGAGEAAGASVGVPSVVVQWAPLGAEGGTAPHPLAEQIIHGIERIAAAFEADEPVVWNEHRARLSFGNGPLHERVHRAWHAAVELWERTCLDLGLPARIGVACDGTGREKARRPSMTWTNRAMRCSPWRPSAPLSPARRAEGRA